MHETIQERIRLLGGSVVLIMLNFELRCCACVIFPIDRHSCQLYAFKRVYGRLTGAEATRNPPVSIINSPDQLSISPSVERGPMVPFSSLFFAADLEVCYL